MQVAVFADEFAGIGFYQPFAQAKAPIQVRGQPVDLVLQLLNLFASLRPITLADLTGLRTLRRTSEGIPNVSVHRMERMFTKNGP